MVATEPIAGRPQVCAGRWRVRRIARPVRM